MQPQSSTDVVSRPRIAHPVALWVLVVQCLLALSWTMYVLFLPALLVSAGVARTWFAAVLVADQAIFAVTDWYAGLYADRVAHLWTRLGRIITATALVSSAALLAMPWVADCGNAPLLLGIIAVWAVTSSALRAPVFALLGRVREEGHSPERSRAGALSIALVGIGLAGALGPYVTLWLKGVEPHLPMGISALVLAIAALWALRAERVLPVVEQVAGKPTSEEHAASRLARRRAWALAIVTFVATFGTQMMTGVVVKPLVARFVGGSEILWGACFWSGFTLALFISKRAASQHRPQSFAMLALAGGAAAFLIGTTGGNLVVLGAALVLAGAAWSVFTTIVFALAVSLSGGRASTRGAGTAAGMLFSAIAACTLVRLVFVASGAAAHPLTLWIPEATWLVAVLLLAVVTRRLWRAS
jgi:MFS family permease